MMEPGSTTDNNSFPRWMVQLVGEPFGVSSSKSWPLLILGTGISIVWSALVPAQPANTPAEGKNGR